LLLSLSLYLSFSLLIIRGTAALRVRVSAAGGLIYESLLYKRIVRGISLCLCSVNAELLRGFNCRAAALLDGERADGCGTKSALLYERAQSPGNRNVESPTEIYAYLPSQRRAI